MNKTIRFRQANPGDATFLSSLAIRSKAYWGYSTEFMKACVDELTVSSADIKDKSCHYMLAEIDKKIIGFYQLEELVGDEIELGALFVDPEHIGAGVGKALIQRAIHHAGHLGASRLNIQGDPNAEKFYRAAGGQPTGSKESESIPGRFLPTFQIMISVDPDT